MKEVIAKTRVPYAKKYREKGDRFEATDKHAHVLVTIGKCEYAPEKEIAEKSEQTPTAAKKRGRSKKVEQAND